MSRMIESSSVESANQAIYLILLIPIALISLPLTYNMNLSRYTAKEEDLTTSSWSRMLFSILATIVILAISRYLFIVINFSL